MNMLKTYIIFQQVLKYIVDHLLQGDCSKHILLLFQTRHEAPHFWPNSWRSIVEAKHANITLFKVCPTNHLAPSFCYLRTPTLFLYLHSNICSSPLRRGTSYWHVDALSNPYTEGSNCGALIEQLQTYFVRNFSTCFLYVF